MASAIVLAGLIMAFANVKSITLLAWIAPLLGSSVLAAAAFTNEAKVLGGVMVLSARALALIPVMTDGSVVSLGILPILPGGMLGGN